MSEQMPEQMFALTITWGHVWLASKVIAGILVARQEFKYPFFQGGVETARPLHVILRRVLRNIAINPEWGIAKLVAFSFFSLFTGTKYLKHFLPWSISPKCPDCKDKGWYYTANFVKPARARRLAGVAFPSLSHTRTICKCEAGEAEQGPPVVVQPVQFSVGRCAKCDKPVPLRQAGTCTCRESDLPVQALGVVRGCPFLYQLGVNTSSPYWVISCDSDFVKNVSKEPLFHCEDPDRTGVYQDDDYKKAEAEWIVLVNQWSRYVLNKNEERPADAQCQQRGKITFNRSV